MTKSLKEIWPTNGLHSQGHRIQLSNVRFFFRKNVEAKIAFYEILLHITFEKIDPLCIGLRS